MRQSDLDRHLDAVASLGDPLRRELYRCVTRHDEGVGRDEAAATVGISRALAAYHLDKLVAAGLLDTRFSRRTGRRGPGAGRTAKLYLRSAEPVDVALPAREYPLLAELLARAVEADPSGTAAAALDREARAAGSASRTGGHGALRTLLTDAGYEPYHDQGVIRLRNCPFERLARTHRDLVCRTNLAFVEGLLEDQRGSRRAVLDPRPGHCCVAVV